MAVEKETLTKPDLPHEQWMLVLRLADFADRPYGEAHAGFLMDLLGVEVMADEGILYGHLETVSRGAAVFREIAEGLARALRVLDLEPEVDARVAPADQIEPSRPLKDSFVYMDDVTDSFRAELVVASQMAEPIDIDFEAQFGLRN